MTPTPAETSQPLHVALVSFGLDGGMAQYSAMLANALTEFADVTVISPDTDETRALFAESVSFRGVPVATGTDSRLRGLSRNLRGFLDIQRHVRLVDADIVHVPFVAGVPSAVSTILIALQQTPVVGTVHDPESHTGQEIDVLGVDLKEQLDRLSAMLTDRTILHGEQCRQQAAGLGYPMDRVRVVPHGLYTHFADHATGAPTEDHTLLFFGTIRPNKGFDRIPELLDRVSEMVPDVTAIVAGSPDVPPQVDSAAVDETVSRLSAHDRVELHDEYIPNEDVATYFERASAVVLPYYDATASGVAMAAYTFGKPIVATQTGDLGRMVEADGTGLLADNTTAALAEQTTQLLTDDELRRRCADNIREVRDDYSWQQIAADTVDIYWECLDDESAGWL